MDIEYYKKYEPIFGSWHIERELGRGSYGTVFEITRQEFGETYRAALKAITIPRNEGEWNSFAIENGTTEENVSSYFQGIVNDYQKEISLMNRLKGNSYIVSYENHQVSEHEDGRGWDILIQMELLTPLYEYIKSQGGSLNEADVIRLGKDICSALEVCEKNNILHRDIKQDNIFVSNIGNFKLGDFGSARIIEKMTGASTRAGADDYMAPEVYKEEGGYDNRADIYSLGMTMYCLLNNNRKPFMPAPPRPIYPNDRERASRRRLGGEALPVPSQASHDVAKIILKACEYNPENRFDSAHAMRETLINGFSTEPNEYIIEATCEENGYIDPKGKIKVCKGGEITIKFHPDEGYIVSYVEIDGLASIKEGVSCISYTFDDVNSGHFINVGFKKEEIKEQTNTEDPDEEEWDGLKPDPNMRWKRFLVTVLVVALVFLGCFAIYKSGIFGNDGRLGEENVTEELDDNEKLGLDYIEQADEDIYSDVGEIGEEGERISGDEQEYSNIPSRLPIYSQNQPSEYDIENGCIYIDVLQGEHIEATGAGTVTYSDESEELNDYLVMIDHDNGYVSFYYCQSRPIIKEHEYVERDAILYTIETETDRVVYRVLYEGNFIDPYTVLNI